MIEYHCECCMCPKNEWKKTMKTYDGDECELYESFSSLIEDWMTPEDLTKVAITELPREYNDIKDINETVKELVEIVIECGVIRPSQSL